MFKIMLDLPTEQRKQQNYSPQNKKHLVSSSADKLTSSQI
jgi:hypothetical protein